MSEEAAADGSAFAEWLGVCPARLATKIAEETSRAGVLQRIQRGYPDDEDFLPVADLMAALPPFCLVIRSPGYLPHRRRIINQSGRHSAFWICSDSQMRVGEEGDVFRKMAAGPQELGFARVTACDNHVRSRSRGQMDLGQGALKTLGGLFQLAL